MIPRYWGCDRAIRQMPRDWQISDPDARLIVARSLVWLAVKTVAGAALVILLYAVAA